MHKPNNELLYMCDAEECSHTNLNHKYPKELLGFVWKTYLRTAPVRSIAFSEISLSTCSRFFLRWREMMRRMAGLRISPFRNTLQRRMQQQTGKHKGECVCEQAWKTWRVVWSVYRSSHCMMQGRVMTFLHFAETLGLPSVVVCEKIYIWFNVKYMHYVYSIPF